MCWVVPAVQVTPVCHARHLDVGTNRGAGEYGEGLGNRNLDSRRNLRRKKTRNNRKKMIARNGGNSSTNMGDTWRLELILTSLLYAEICTGSECFLWTTTYSADPIRAHAPVVTSCVGPLKQCL